MSGTNATQAPNGYNPPSDLSTDESDNNLWDEVDNLDVSEDGAQTQVQPSFDHKGSIQDQIKALTSGAKKLPSATLDELNNILTTASDFDDHQFEDKAWSEIDLAKDLLKKNGVQDPSADNGAGSDQSQGALNPDHKDKDTAVSSVDNSKGTATYNSNLEVTLHNYFNKDGINTTNIQEATSVTLYPAAPTDSFVVTFDKETNQFKIDTTGGNSQTKTYFVDPAGLTNKITIASSKVDTSKLTKEQRDKIQVGLDAAADEKAKKLDIINSVQWPAGGIASYVNFVDNDSNHDGGGGTLAEYIVKGKAGGGDSDGIDLAMTTGNWDGVISEIQHHSDHTWNWGWTQYNDEYANDAIRKIVTGIYRASGAKGENDPRFMGLLKKIPVTVRSAMREAVLRNSDEKHENHGDQWDSQKTADILDTSISSDTGDSKDKTSDITSSTSTSTDGGDNNTQDANNKQTDSSN